ncbi:MotE family protein [Acetobacter malorum]|nr:hypothetical protein [Acetobacter malorum]
MMLSGLSLSKAVHLSSSLMTVLLALNLHSLAAKFGDTPAPDRPQTSAEANTGASDKSTPVAVAAAIENKTARQKLNDSQGWQEKGADTKPTDTSAASADDKLYKSLGSVKVDESISDIDPRVMSAKQSLMGDIADRQSQMGVRQKAMDAARQVIDQEQNSLGQQIQTLSDGVSELTAKKEAQRKAMDGEYDRLARVYEQMPPRDAAAVFNVLDMHVMVPVASRMAPLKVSKVIGGMDPDRANILSQYIAGTRHLSPLKDAPPAPILISTDRNLGNGPAKPDPGTSTSEKPEDGGNGWDDATLKASRQ